MFTINNILRGISIILILVFLGQNFRAWQTTKRQEQLLLSHLHRLSKKNDKYERLSVSGAKLLKQYPGYEFNYLDENGKLSPEYLVPLDTTMNTIGLLDQLHQQEMYLSNIYNDIFSHNNCFAHPPVLVKSILDNHVHVGKYYTNGIGTKYDVFINSLPVEYSINERYDVACTDTINLQINILRINYKTYGIDTTIVKEQIVPSTL